MKKVVPYVWVAVGASIILVGGWVYVRYFKVEQPKFVQMQVGRGDIQELVKVRGEVVSEQEFDLSFPFGGVVERVFVQQGQEVEPDVPLVQLDTTELQLERKTLEAQVAGSQAAAAAARAQLRQYQAALSGHEARLAEIRRGVRPEEIDVDETRLAAAKTAQNEARKQILHTLHDAYTKSDDAVRSRVDQFFEEPRGDNPEIKFSTDSQLASRLKQGRKQVESLLRSWKVSLDRLTVKSDLASALSAATKNLGQVRALLETAALALGSAEVTNEVPQTTLDVWKTNLSIGRANVELAMANVAGAEAIVASANTDVALVEQQLTLKQSGATVEQIAAQEAQVRSARAAIDAQQSSIVQLEAATAAVQSQVAVLDEKIRKATLHSPGKARVTNIVFDEQELFTPGQVALSLATNGHRVEADVSELEIGKIMEEDAVTVRLDAFPELTIPGKVVSIDPKEIMKEGDRYFRLNVYLEPHAPEIRAGMSVDLSVRTAEKKRVIKIPAFMVVEQEEKYYADVLEGSMNKRIEIKTGISDGEFIEVREGLQEGQVVVVPAS